METSLSFRMATALGLILVFSLLGPGRLAAQQDMQSIQDKYDSLKISIKAPDGSGPEFMNWTVSEGFKEINEPTLLRLTGYKKEADVSSRRLAFMQGMLWGGVGLCIGGILGMGASVAFQYSKPISSAVMWSSVGLAGGGLVCMYVDLCMGHANTQPLGRINQIARDYNQQLLDSINDGK
jgi:hypothetical protein